MVEARLTDELKLILFDTEKGKEMLEEAAVDGAGGIIVNFLRPRYGLGVLVEFVQQVK